MGMRSPKPLATVGVALFFIAGCTTLGWLAGLAAFAGAYEVLRALGREEVLESQSLFHNAKLIAGAAGFLAGAAIFGTWRRNAAAPADSKSAWLKLVAICSLATLGAAPLAALVVLLSAILLRMGLEVITYLVIGTAIAMLAVCFMITKALSGPNRGRVPLFFASGTFAVTLLIATLALNALFGSEYGDAGRPRRIVVEIALPENADLPAAESVTMRTPSGTIECNTFGSWEREGGRALLQMGCIYTKLEAGRTIVVKLAGQPEIAITLPFGRNPRAMARYSAFLPLAGNLAYRYRIDNASVFGG
jgi:hypothetical protein